MPATVHSFTNSYEEIEPIEISSVVDFLSKIPPPPDGLENYFRGHKRASYELIPSLFRTTKPKPDWESYGNDLIKEFLRNAGRHLSSLPEDEFAIIALAQHHGVPTDFLDWSLSPLVALFFAVEDLEPGTTEEDAHLWTCTGTATRRDPHPAFESGYMISGETYFIPPFINSRMAAQQGCFTMFRHTDHWPRNGEPCKPFNMRMAYEPKLFRIPHAEREHFQVELNILGINYSTIFPDLEGLGKHIAWSAKQGLP